MTTPDHLHMDIDTYHARARARKDRPGGAVASKDFCRALELAAHAERSQELIDAIIAQCKTAQTTIEHEEQNRREGRAFDPYAARRAFIEIAGMVDHLLQMQRPA